MSHMFQSFRPRHLTREALPAPTPGLGKTVPDAGSCPICWGFGKKIPLRDPCPVCAERPNIYVVEVLVNAANGDAATIERHGALIDKAFLGELNPPKK
jgi:hypothetical protein